MISADLVLDYVKMNLGVPLVTMEITDEDLISYYEKHVLPEFSKYVPDRTGYAVIDPKDSNVTTQWPNRFKILDAYGRDVISILNVIQGMSVLYAHGMPYSSGFTQLGEVPEYGLEYVAGMTAYQFSAHHVTWQYHHPNIVEIFPSEAADDGFTIRYERSQEFASIPVEWDYEIKELCLGHTELLLAARRDKYTNLSTPFGDINLNADNLRSAGQQRRQEILTRLDKQPPNVILRVG